MLTPSSAAMSSAGHAVERALEHEAPAVVADLRQRPGDEAGRVGALLVARVALLGELVAQPVGAVVVGVVASASKRRLALRSASRRGAGRPCRRTRRACLVALTHSPIVVPLKVRDHLAPQLDERALDGLVALVGRQAVAARAHVNHAAHAVEVGLDQLGSTSAARRRRRPRRGTRRTGAAAPRRSDPHSSGRPHGARSDTSTPHVHGARAGGSCGRAPCGSASPPGAPRRRRLGRRAGRGSRPPRRARATAARPRSSAAAAR